MKRIIKAIAIASALFCGAALASPAQDLFDQTSYYLTFNYNGFSKVAPGDVEAKYQTQLDTACLPEGDTCKYETAVPVITNWVKEINDEHTNYYSPADFAAFNQEVAGGAATQFPIVGIQMLLVPKTKTPRIIEVLPGSPGDIAGLKRGDLLLSFNGQEFGDDPKTFNANLTPVVRSTPEVVFKLKRGEQILEIKVNPAIYTNTGLPYLEKINDSTARFRIPSFVNPKTGIAIHDLVKEAQNKNFSTLVIDLRNDGGGISSECLSGVGAFIGNLERTRESRFKTNADGYKDGTVYSRDERGTNTAYTIKDPALFKGKISVLVNKNTGSCAEYFASDVQHAKRAPILGDKTAGVGNTGTRFFELLNGGAIQVTILRSLFSTGEPYPEFVTPDVEQADDLDGFVATGVDSLLEAGVAQAR